jgi:hypothetical protein
MLEYVAEKFEREKTYPRYRRHIATPESLYISTVKDSTDEVECFIVFAKPFIHNSSSKIFYSREDFMNNARVIYSFDIYVPVDEYLMDPNRVVVGKRVLTEEHVTAVSPQG